MKSLYIFINSKLYRNFTTTVVCLQIIIIIAFTTKDAFIENEHSFYSTCSLIVTLIFFIEYIVRFYTAPDTYKKYKPARARIVYATSFMGLVDLLCMLPFLIYYVAHFKISFDFFDFSLVILIFKMARYSEGFKLVISAFRSVRQQLVTVIAIASIFLIFASLMMYYLEKSAQPEKFTNVGEGFWWAIITFTTVGYGDVYPITPFGKLLGAISAVIGIFMIALPSGIIRDRKSVV